VRGKFLAKGHKGEYSIEIGFGPSLTVRSQACNPKCARRNHVLPGFNRWRLIALALEQSSRALVSRWASLAAG